MSKLTDKEMLQILCEDLLDIEREVWYDLVKNHTKEERLAFLRDKSQKSLLSAADNVLQLKELLKECKDFLLSGVSWLVSDDLKAYELAEKINQAIGESEVK